MTPLERAASALREAANNKLGAIPSKKYQELKEALIRIALDKPRIGENMNPPSPCCGAETVWVVQEDPGVQCSKCLEWMEFRVTNQEYNKQPVRKNS